MGLAADHGRDLYVESEALANGDRYRRVDVPWKGRTLHGNLHLPVQRAGPAPVVVVVHGIDGCKEEHLATELCLQEAGFCALVMDGPGQGEAMLLMWPGSAGAGTGLGTVLGTILARCGCVR